MGKIVAVRAKKVCSFLAEDGSMLDKENCMDNWGKCLYFSGETKEFMYIFRSVLVRISQEIEGFFLIFPALFLSHDSPFGLDYMFNKILLSNDVAFPVCRSVDVLGKGNILSSVNCENSERADAKNLFH